MSTWCRNSHALSLRLPRYPDHQHHSPTGLLAGVGHSEPAPGRTHDWEPAMLHSTIYPTDVPTASKLPLT